MNPNGKRIKEINRRLREIEGERADLQQEENDLSDELWNIEHPDESTPRRQSRLQPMHFVDSRISCPKCGGRNTSSDDGRRWDCDHCGHVWKI